MTATTSFTSHLDSSASTQPVSIQAQFGGNNWATEDFSRTASVTPLGLHTGPECGTLSPCYQFTGSLQDSSGAFTTLKATDGTNAVSPQAGAVLHNPPVKGTFAGGTVTDFTFYADSNIVSDTRVPATVTGSGPSVGTSGWLSLMFPSGTHFQGSLLPNWSWTYKDAFCEQWVDAFDNSDGSLPADGDITGFDHCTDTVTVTNPGSQSWTAGTPVSLQIHASSTDPNVDLSYAASGLPAGLSINSSTGLISGTPTTASNFNATVTATSSRSHSDSATFAWTVQTATVTPPPPVVSNNVVIRNRWSGKCLNEDQKTGLLSQFTCSGVYVSLQWRTVRYSDGTTYLQSVQTGQYVTSSTQGAQLVLSSSRAGHTTAFLNGGIFRFPNSLVMDDKAKSKSNFAAAIGWPYNGQDNQRWDFQKVPA